MVKVNWEAALLRPTPSTKEPAGMVKVYVEFLLMALDGLMVRVFPVSVLVVVTVVLPFLRRILLKALPLVTFSFRVMVMLDEVRTPVALSTGVVAATKGAVLSILIVWFVVGEVLPNISSAEYERV